MNSLLWLTLALVLSGIAHAGPTITPEEAKDYLEKTLINPLIDGITRFL